MLSLISFKLDSSDEDRQAAWQQEVGQRSRTKKRKDKLQISPQQEEEFFSWFKDNEMLWCKSHAQFFNKDKKEELWEEQADKMNIPSK